MNRRKLFGFFAAVPLLPVAKCAPEPAMAKPVSLTIRGAKINVTMTPDEIARLERVMMDVPLDPPTMWRSNGMLSAEQIDKNFWNLHKRIEAMEGHDGKSQPDVS